MMENHTVSDEILNLKNQLKQVGCERDAAKGMYNEAANSSLVLRTNMHMLQQAYQELNDKNVEISKQLDVKDAQLAVLNAKVLELCPPNMDSSKPEPELHAVNES